MKDKKTKILTLLTILLILVIGAVITILIINKKDNNSPNNTKSNLDNNKDIIDSIVFDYDFVNNYMKNLYGSSDNKIIIEEDDEEFVAVVRDSNDKFIAKLTFNKTDKSIANDTSEAGMSSGVSSGPELEDGDVNE